VRLLHYYRGEFWYFDKNSYRPCEDVEIRSVIWKFLDQAQKTVTPKNGEKRKKAHFKPLAAQVSNVSDALIAQCAMSSDTDPPFWLDHGNLPPANEFFVAANGLLHLKSGELFDPTPNYFGCVAASAVAFDLDAPPPSKWLKFLAGVFNNDKEAINTLHEWMGLLLTADTSFQKILLMVGPPRSGKGTIARVITHLRGRFERG
jgi:putative DNA primase/helicase